MSIRQRLSVMAFRFLPNKNLHNQHAIGYNISSKLSTACRYSTVSLFHSPNYVIRNKSNGESINKCVSLKYSTDANQPTIPVVTYEEVKDLPNHPEKWLIDVREPAELVETGIIPTAINIPRKSVMFSLILAHFTISFLQMLVIFVLFLFSGRGSGCI